MEEGRGGKEEKRIREEEKKKGEEKALRLMTFAILTV